MMERKVFGFRRGGGGSEVVELNGLFEEVRRVGVWSRLVGITLFEVCL